MHWKVLNKITNSSSTAKKLEIFQKTYPQQYYVRPKPRYKEFKILKKLRCENLRSTKLKTKIRLKRTAMSMKLQTKQQYKLKYATIKYDCSDIFRGKVKSINS